MRQVAVNLSHDAQIEAWFNQQSRTVLMAKQNSLTDNHSSAAGSAECCVYVLRFGFQTELITNWASPVAFTVFACQQGPKLKLP